MNEKLYDQIETFNQSNLVIERWNNLKPILMTGAFSSTQTVGDSYRTRYRGDFYGLLKQVFKLKELHFYPTLLANNFNSPYDYAGQEVITLLDSAEIERLYLLAVKEK